MMNEQKMERLLRMAEHPELYDDRELEELMCDEECREAYELMVELGASRGPSKEKEMQSSSQSLQGGGALGGKRLDKSSFLQEWEDVRPERLAGKRAMKIRWKMAAMFVGVVMMAGFAFAAIHLATRHRQSDVRQTAVIQQVKKRNQVSQRRDSVKSSSPEGRPGEVALPDLLSAIAAHYHLTVAYKNERVRQLRLFFKWDKTRSIEEIVADLNHFEHIHLTLEGQKLTVE